MTLFKCVQCEGELGPTEGHENYVCSSCDRMFPLTDGILDLTPPGYRPDPEKDHGSATDLFLRRKLVGTWKGDAGEVRDFIEGGLRRIHEGTVVDVACLSGLFSLRSQPLGREVTYLGFDSSIPLLKRARSVLLKQKVNGQVVRADWDDLPLATGQLQGVIAIQVIHQSSNVVALLRELSGLLEEGGQLILTVPVADGPARHLERLGTRITVLTRPAWREIFREQGFRILESAESGSLYLVRLGRGSLSGEEE